MLDVSKYRYSFPILKDYIQLSSCSQSALHQNVRKAMNQYVDIWESEGMNWGAWMDVCEDARRKFAGLINADPEEVAIVSSVSHAVSAIATSIQRSKGKNRVFITDGNFPCVGHVWLSQDNAEVSFIEPVNGEWAPEQFEQQITADTLLTSISHVSYYDGFKQDLLEVANAVHNKGSYLFVDAYQSAGQTPIDVKRMDVDFLTAGMQKYLLGIPGIAFLYIKKEIAEQMTPEMTGWFGQADPFAFDLKKADYAASARRFDSGTFPMINGYAANAALDVLLEVGVKSIEEHLRNLSGYTIDYALEKGLVVRSTRDLSKKGSNTAIQVPNASKVEQQMKQKGFIVSARNDVIRIAPHFYNNREDIKAAVDALATIV